MRRRELEIKMGEGDKLARDKKSFHGERIEIRMIFSKQGEHLKFFG